MAKELKLGLEEILEGASLVVKSEERIDTGVKVRRRPYISKKDKKQYWLYYSVGKIRGRTFEINFTPAGKDDVGGFAVMDLAFGEGEDVTLYKTDYTYKNKEGNEVAAVRYEIGFSDEFGDLFAVVKPAKGSDQKMLDLTIDYAAKLKAKAEAESAAENIVPDPEKPDKNKKG